MGIVEVEGARLRYVIEGQGAPVLVIGSSVYYPRLFSQALREHLQMVFLDLRHFATTDPAFGADRVTRDVYADDIEHVRRTLELGDVFVMGHSLAGAIALEYARRYPDHVRGVVAVGGHAYRTIEEPTPATQLWESDASEERKQILARNQAELTPELLANLSPAEVFVRRYLANAPKAWYDPTYDDSWLWEDVAPNMPLINRVYGELFKDYDLARERPEITVPVLVVHGRYDYLVAHNVWDERLHKLPRHTYALMEESAHSPPLEEPDRFDAILLDWVQGLQEPPGS